MAPLRKTPGGDSGGEAGDVEDEGVSQTSPCVKNTFTSSCITSNREVWHLVPNHIGSKNMGGIQIQATWLESMLLVTLLATTPRAPRLDSDWAAV